MRASELAFEAPVPAHCSTGVSGVAVPGSSQHFSREKRGWVLVAEQPGLGLDSNPTPYPTFSLVNPPPYDSSLPFVKVEVGQTLCCWSASRLVVTHISHHVSWQGYLGHQRDLRIGKRGSQFSESVGVWGWETLLLTIQLSHPRKL